MSTDRTAEGVLAVHKATVEGAEGVRRGLGRRALARQRCLEGRQRNIKEAPGVARRTLADAVLLHHAAAVFFAGHPVVCCLVMQWIELKQWIGISAHSQSDRGGDRLDKK